MLYRYSRLSVDKFDGLSIKNAVFLLEYGQDLEKENERGRLIAASYTAWQMGAGEKKSFLQYIKHLGLVESMKLSGEQKKKIAEQAHRIADKIKRMDKPRKK